MLNYNFNYYAKRIEMTQSLGGSSSVQNSLGSVLAKEGEKELNLRTEETYNQLVRDKVNGLFKLSENGESFTANLESVKRLGLEATQASAETQKRIGDFYRFGKHGLKKDEAVQEAIKWYTQKNWKFHFTVGFKRKS